MTSRAPAGRRHAKGSGSKLADPQDMLSGSLPLHSDWRDRASLTAGPAGLIAERALANDVTDYIRFRAVCTSWHACCPDPLAGPISDPRFHPRRWIMLPSATKAGNQPRCLLNIYTGERIHVSFPDLQDYDIIGRIADGLLALCRKGSHVVQLLNLLTRQLTEFPRATGQLLPCDSSEISATNAWLRRSGGLADDSTVALLQGGPLYVAKPGDEDWTQLRTDEHYWILLALPFAGRLYCVTNKYILAVETAADQKARLVVVAELKLEGGFSLSDDYLYPVYHDEGGLIIVHRHPTDSCSNDKFAAYRVELDAGNVERISDLGGQALFVCGCRSQSVAARVSSSIRADTIYVCTNHFQEKGRPKVVAFFDLLGTGTPLDKKDVPDYLFDYVCSV